MHLVCTAIPSCYWPPARKRRHNEETCQALALVQGWLKVVFPKVLLPKVVRVNGKLSWARSDPTGQDCSIVLDLPSALMIGCHMRPAASKKIFSVVRATAHGSRSAIDLLGAVAVRLQNMSRLTTKNEHILTIWPRPRLS